MNPCCTGCEGEAMLLVSAALASGIAAGKSLEDLAVLSALFTIMGDQLSLLAIVRERCDSGQISQGQAP